MSLSATVDSPLCARVQSDEDRLSFSHVPQNTGRSKADGKNLEQLAKLT